MSFWSKKSTTHKSKTSPPNDSTPRRLSPPSRPSPHSTNNMSRSDSGHSSRQDLFQGSGYDAVNRRQQNMNNPYSVAGHQYHRHPDEENGYFNSKQDEEHAYQQTLADIHTVKGQSVDTSRSALRRLRETEEIASASMRKLQEQSDKLTAVESRMTDADYFAHRAENKTQDLQKLNKNFIISSVGVANPFTKSKRREAQLQKEVEDRRRLDEDKQSQKNSSRMHNRQLDSALDQVRSQTVSSGGRSRSNYLDHDDENCAMEREIDSNLDEISGALSRLKVMGQSMSESISRTNEQIGRIDKRADTVNDRVRRTETKLSRLS